LDRTPRPYTQNHPKAGLIVGTSEELSLNG